MKKYILIGLIIILSKLSFVYANSEQLKQLAGKMIYRDVPAQNETEFSMEFVGKPYQLIYYSNCLIELKDSEGATFVRYRSLWDDGNWKEYKENNKNEIRVLFHPRWYVGMEVCDILEGRGTIVGISNKKDDSYPIRVRFDKEEKRLTVSATYTLDGAYMTGQIGRLFPTERREAVFDFDKLFPRKKKNGLAINSNDPLGCVEDKQLDQKR